MFSRIFIPPAQSYFLFGPRGTGKSTFLRDRYSGASMVDLLDDEIYTTLLADPKKLSGFVTGKSGPVIIDEVQKLPALLDEVHRLMEGKRWRFVLTGSSARKLKRGGANLLAGRALTERLYPLTVRELGREFSLERSLSHGHLPMAWTVPDPQKYLASYVRAYVDEEVKQEGLVRNLGGFTRFLQAASFSQGAVLNVSDVARECAVERKVVENYFTILEDLLLAYRLPIFSKKAKRRLLIHPKFYFFDVGVYRAIRPKGPLDEPEEIGGASLETLVFQELLAANAYGGKGYDLFYWHTGTHFEVDFILYGARGLIAIEVKRARRPDSHDLRGLKAFLEDYPKAKAYLLCGTGRKTSDGKVEIWPTEAFLRNLPEIL